MSKHTSKTPSVSIPGWADLESWVRLQIQGLLQRLLEEEVTEFLGRVRYARRSTVDASPGYRNGYGKSRRLCLSSGTIAVKRPRIRGLEARFESRILPLFARRTKGVSDLLPQLYLHGLSQGDFELALRGLLGEGAPLSAASIGRLRSTWQREYDSWKQRRLDEDEVVYVWADGIYVKAGLEKEKAALLVVMGAMSDGRKEVLALEPGYRESAESWASVLRGLRDRGVKQAPRLLVADGHLGIWAAVTQIWPETAEQRCWNHKILNVLGKLPKGVQEEARVWLTQIPYAPTRQEAEARRDDFAQRYRAWYADAVDTLERDWERMVTFYDFPQAHWRHLRTTNVVESPFAAVRLRTDAAKRFKKVANATALIWRILRVAETRFRRLDAPELMPMVYAGHPYENGVPINTGKQVA